MRNRGTAVDVMHRGLVVALNVVCAAWHAAAQRCGY